jgi:surface antigen
VLRLRCRLHRAAALAVVLCGVAEGGCSYQLHSLLSKDDDAAVSQTASIAKPADRGRVEGDHRAAEVDLAYARHAASEALAHTAKDASVPWQNPTTGAGGNITPLATSYNEGGLPCRDFLASYAHDGSQDWLQGAACRTGEGSWEVKSLKPLKPS